LVPCRSSDGVVVVGAKFEVVEVGAGAKVLKLFLFVTLAVNKNQRDHNGSTHRDKTRVQMLAKMFPHLKLLCWLFMGPTCGLTQSKETVFDQIWCFLRIKTRF
jgi:hypothetical protein